MIMIDLYPGPRIRYYGQGSVKLIIEKDPNYFKKWASYQKFLSENDDVDELTAEIFREKINEFDYYGPTDIPNIKEIQQYIDKTAYLTPNINILMRDDDFIADTYFYLERFQDDSSSVNPDIHNTYNRQEFEVGLKSRKEENLYGMHHAIYQAGQLQKKVINYETKTPIVMGVYPKETKDMAVAIAKKMYGSENVINTDSKDFDYFSVVDDLGRSEVMMFAEISDLFVPTSAQILEFEFLNKVSRSDYPFTPDQEKVNRLNMQERSFCIRPYNLFDVNYSIRLILATIKSIQENKIDMINEKVSFHSISSMIRQYPVLTEVAKNPEKFNEKLDEIVVIAKKVQSEYDFRNMQTFTFPEISTRNEKFDIYVPLCLHQSDSKALFESRLSDAELEIAKSLDEEKRLESVPPLENTMKKRVVRMKNDWIEAFLTTSIENTQRLVDKNVDTRVAIDELQKMKHLNSSREFYGFNIFQAKKIFSNTKAINNPQLQKYASFLNYLAEADVSNLDPNEIFNMMMKDTDISNYNLNSLKHIMSNIILTVSEYQEKIKNMDNIYDIMNEYHLLVPRIFSIDLIANNEQQMKKAVNFDMRDYRLPIEYMDITPMIKKIESLSADGMSEEEIMDSMSQMYRNDPSAIVQVPLKSYERNAMCESFVNFNRNTNPKVMEQLGNTSPLQTLQTLYNEIGETLGFTGEEYEAILNNRTFNDSNDVRVRLLVSHTLNQQRNDINQHHR